jgi:hypothetical protein
MTHTTPPRQQSDAQARKSILRRLKTRAALCQLTADGFRKVDWTWPNRRWQPITRRFQFGIMSFSRKAPPKG